jgi:hypothetical protein
MMTLVGLGRASMWSGALHIILFIYFAHVVVFRENTVCAVFSEGAPCLFSSILKRAPLWKLDLFYCSPVKMLGTRSPSPVESPIE